MDQSYSLNLNEAAAVLAMRAEVSLQMGGMVKTAAPDITGFLNKLQNPQGQGAGYTIGNRALIGGGIGAGAGLLSTLFSNRKKKRWLGNALTGALAGGGIGAGVGIGEVSLSAATEDPASAKPSEDIAKGRNLLSKGIANNDQAMIDQGRQLINTGTTAQRELEGRPPAEGGIDYAVRPGAKITGALGNLKDGSPGQALSDATAGGRDIYEAGFGGLAGYTAGRAVDEIRSRGSHRTNIATATHGLAGTGSLKGLTPAQQRYVARMSPGELRRYTTSRGAAKTYPFVRTALSAGTGKAPPRTVGRGGRGIGTALGLGAGWLVDLFGNKEQ